MLLKVWVTMTPKMTVKMRVKNVGQKLKADYRRKQIIEIMKLNSKIIANDLSRIIQCNRANY